MNIKQEIIDTHFHIWDTQRLSLPWLSLFQGKLKKKYSLDDYLKAIRGLNIKESCYEEVDAIAQQHSQEADMIIGVCKDRSNQVYGATIAADLLSPDFKTYLEKYANEEVVKSVRHNFFAADARISQEIIFKENTRLLAEFGIMCDLVMPVDKMHYGIELVESCPETLFVINHCGVCPVQGDKDVINTWRQGILELSSKENTICKISECGFTKPNYSWQLSDMTDIIHHCISSFGENRIVYGTNWPVCEMTAPISRWLEAIKVCLNDFPDHYANQLFYVNAKRYYQL